MTTADAPTAPIETYTPTAQAIKKEIARRSWCTLATASADGRPHVVGLNYAFVDGEFYFVTGQMTKKVRNIRENPNVAVCIPVRKLPIGPPFAVQFQGIASIHSPDDPEISALLEAGKLKKATPRVDIRTQPDGCVLKVRPAHRIHSFGLGIPIRVLLRDVTKGDRTVIFNENGG